MNKSFLDKLYQIRVAVINDITRLEEITKDSISEDIELAELRTRRSELSSIDDLINAYLDLYR